ncbi:MAG: hypothetical protein AAF612_00195 [Planctomycetota bacterium]
MSEPTPPTNTPSDTPVRDDTPRRVEHDLPCLRCGFNLRTLPVDADCPECRLPVRASDEGSSWRRRRRGHY